MIDDGACCGGGGGGTDGDADATAAACACAACVITFDIAFAALLVMLLSTGLDDDGVGGLLLFAIDIVVGRKPPDGVVTFTLPAPLRNASLAAPLCF